MLCYRAEYHSLAVFHYPSSHTISQAGRLLVYFLEHKVFVAALVEHVEVQFHILDLDLHQVIVESEHLEIFAPAAQRYLAVAEIYHSGGVFCDRGGVAGDEELAVSLSYAYGHRAAFARGYECVRILPVYDHYGIGADDLAQGQTHAGRKVLAGAVKGVLYELHEHLGVRFALEMVALGPELLAQYRIVLYDSIVDYGESSVLALVRVGVVLGRKSVGGPSGVGYAYASGVRSVGCYCFEADHLSFCLVYLQGFRLFVEHRDSGGVITSVFESVEAFDEYGICLSVSGVSYNSTHILILCSILKNESRATLSSAQWLPCLRVTRVGFKPTTF